MPSQFTTDASDTPASSLTTGTSTARPRIEVVGHRQFPHVYDFRRITTGRACGPVQPTTLRSVQVIPRLIPVPITPSLGLSLIPEVVGSLGMSQIGRSVGFGQRLPDRGCKTRSSGGGNIDLSFRACSASSSSRVNVVRIVAII